MQATREIGVDTAALEAWMQTHVSSFTGNLMVERFAGGQSNPTYKLTTPHAVYVLRCKPPGELLPGAHAVEREARVLAALAKPNFPVPLVHGLCTDDRVIGTSFYVMEMVEGRIFWDATFPGVPAASRPAYFTAMNRTLAELHSIDPATVGLDDFGRTENYLHRQITRWSRQYLADEAAGRDPFIDRLIAWLPHNIPNGEERSIVHGDFRCDNMIFHPDEPKILAVLDWELSTIGHPLVDFCYHAMMYRMPPNIVAGLAGADLSTLNIPDEAAYVAEYCRYTGRPSLPDYDYYMAFNFFRLAAIFHGIKGRAARGSAASAQAELRVQVLPELAALAWEQARRAGAT